MRFCKFIGFYLELAEAFDCQRFSLDACTLSNSLAFMGSSLEHLSVKGAPLMRALCEIQLLLLEAR